MPWDEETREARVIVLVSENIKKEKLKNLDKKNKNENRHKKQWDDMVPMKACRSLHSGLTKISQLNLGTQLWWRVWFNPYPTDHGGRWCTQMVSRYDMKIKENLNMVLRFKYLFMTWMVCQLFTQCKWIVATPTLIILYIWRYTDLKEDTYTFIKCVITLHSRDMYIH